MLDADNPMLHNMSEKTGKDLGGWLKVLKGSSLEKHGLLVKHLKSDHGLTHGYANLIAHKFLKSDAGSAASTTDLVDDQFAKGKEPLRPIYEALASKVCAFGKDVELAPKRAYVSVRRKKQFAIFQPSTKTRFDLGLNLKGAPATALLEEAGSFNSMCSHRIRLTSVDDINDEVIDHLHAAYLAAG